MKKRVALPLTASLLAMTSLSVLAQNLNFPVTPANPTDFETRNIGDSSEQNATYSEPEAPKKIKVSYTAVSDLREWTNIKGVVVRGHLMAWESGNYANSDKLLTIVRDGKVRLLVEGKNQMSELPLSVFGAEDQAYITGLVAARRQAAEAAQAAKVSKTASAPSAPVSGAQ